MQLQEPKAKPLLTLNEEFRRVMAVICEGVSAFRLYDLSRIAVSIGHSRGRGKWGVWAHVIPLHYVGGRAERRGLRWGRMGAYTYECPQLKDVQPEARYLMTFMWPRFFGLSPRERLETIVHELYHVHPTLRGDLRRFAKPHMHHGPTPALFNRQVKSMTEEALRQFPALLDHPLIAGRGEEYAQHKRIRLKHPRRVFRPDPSPLSNLGNWVRGMLLVGAVLTSMLAQAAGPVMVKTTRAGVLHDRPSMNSPTLGNFSDNASFEAVRVSPKKTWIEVRGKGGQSGWLPRAWVQSAGGGSGGPKASVEGAGLPVATPSAGAGAAVGKDDSVETFQMEDEDLGGEGQLSRMGAFDAKSDKFFADQPGRLYEKPSRMASRFGVVEKDDEFQVLGKSPDGQWSQVRLVMTGEEGWFPAARIRRVQESRLRVMGAQSVEMSLPWGSKDHGWGLVAGYFHNLLLGGFENRPRDRFEVGGIVNYWLGKSLSYGSKKADLSFWNIAVMGRYMGASDDGRLSGGVELGLDYHRARIQQTGITEARIAASLKSAAGTSSVGLHLGVVGLYSFNEKWSVELGSRAHVSTGPFASFFAGALYRF